MLIMEMKAFEQTLSLQKDGDRGFCRYTNIITAFNIFIIHV